MAFRIKALFIILTLSAFAQDATVRHRHWRHGATGELRVTDEGIVFNEPGKGTEHSREWKFEEIQQLRLSPTSLSVLTYEDRKWKLGEDREYVFDGLPEGFAAAVYARLRDRLDQRFVAALADPAVQPALEIPAKLLGRIQGTQGTLGFADGRIVFSGIAPGESRTWRFADIDNIASANPFDFSIVTREREFRFQLKRPLSETRYNALWRQLNQSKQKEYEHD